MDVDSKSSFMNLAKTDWFLKQRANASHVSITGTPYTPSTPPP